MNREEIKRQIEEKTSAEVQFDVPMSKYTSMRIGGPAKIFIRITNVDDLKHILYVAKKEDIPIWVLGNGTNTVVKDGGLNKLVLKIDLKEVNYLDNYKDDEYKYVEAYSGVQLKGLTYELAKRGLGPIAHLHGIPATIGGAIKMNAGAYDLEMKDIVYETTYMDLDGNLHTAVLDEHEFGYRMSIFQYNKSIVIKTILRLKEVDKVKELQEAKEIMALREERQPLNYPNSGSFFKRGDDYFASKLIDDHGLKGKQFGGIAVSEKHAGFIVNKDNGTYKDLKELVEYVKDKIYEETGNKLEQEVIVIGDE